MEHFSYMTQIVKEAEYKLTVEASHDLLSVIYSFHFRDY